MPRIMAKNTTGIKAMVSEYSGSSKWTSIRLYWMIKPTEKKKLSFVKTRKTWKGISKSDND
jgi:hypothetical protein